MSDKPIRFRSIAPQFVVTDVVKSAEYYRDVFGFKIYGYWHDPPVYAIVGREYVEIHFGKSDNEGSQSNLIARKHGLDAYIFVEGVDALCDEFTRKGAEIIEGPVNQSYGNREFLVRDCNGFVLAFGESL